MKLVTITFLTSDSSRAQDLVAQLSDVLHSQGVQWQASFNEIMTSDARKQFPQHFAE